MKSCLLLGVVLAAAACSSSSTPGSNASDAATTGDTSSAGDDASTGDASGGEAAALDTWANWGQGFFTKYCVECHGVSDPKGLDFGVQATVVTNMNDIRCGVSVQQDPSWSCPANIAAKQFPISDTAGTNPKPSDAERSRVVAWIAAGAP